MTLHVVDNDTIENAVLNKPYIDPELFLQLF